VIVLKRATDSNVIDVECTHALKGEASACTYIRIVKPNENKLIKCSEMSLCKIR